MAGITVLVASADDGTQAVARLALSNEYDVVTAGDARDAVRAVAAHRPTVFVADVGLPEVGGITTARALRKQPATAGTKVLILADVNAPPTDAQLESAAIDAVLLGPFGALELLHEVRQLTE